MVVDVFFIVLLLWACVGVNTMRVLEGEQEAKLRAMSFLQLFKLAGLAAWYGPYARQKVISKL